MQQKTPDDFKIQPQSQKSLARIELKHDLAANGVVIEEPRKFPEVSINYAVFGEYSDRIEAQVTLLQEYLRWPYVIDKFGTDNEGHENRKNLRGKIKEKYSNNLGEDEINRIFHGSKLSANGRGIIGISLGRIGRALSENSKFVTLANEIKALREKGPSFRKNEDSSWTIEESRTKTEKFEDMIYEILKALSQFSHESI
jgi:hypothetical protein